ncbi:MAG: TraR/DksA C4-type zinc finger protein [Sphaerochaetaceae bacterium]|nr:TraR/DksA C4-type zinc finger protein [uncultured Sphaerochaeta sp.]MDC7229569.1 TraR/DksA C4-type zinc finger protein [Sphaerochaetaceae bacterium]
MKQEDVERMKELITTLLAQLNHHAEFLDQETQAIAPSCSLGRVTRMEAIGEQAISAHAQSLNQKRIIGLENALQRIEKGTYGTCIRCQAEIPLGRLELVPEALLCVQCAEKKRR